MRKLPLFALAAGFALGTGAVALSEERAPGRSGETPGHEMQEHGSVPGSPGASGYAPGHNKDADDLRSRGSTTGSGVRDSDDAKRRGDRDDLRRGDRDHDRDDMKIKRDRD
jgi:hypothetical protein